MVFCFLFLTVELGLLFNITLFPETKINTISKRPRDIDRKI